MHHLTDRIAHTTAFVTSVVEHLLERELNSISLSDRWSAVWWDTGEIYLDTNCSETFLYILLNISP